MANFQSNLVASPFQGGTRASPFQGGSTASPFQGATGGTRNPFQGGASTSLVQPVQNGGMSGVGPTGGGMSINPAFHGLVGATTPVKSVSTDGQGGQTVTYHAPAKTPAPVVPPAPTDGLLYNGVPTSGAPGTLGNNGPVTGATDRSINPIYTPGTSNTPSGATVDANGNLITPPPVAPFTAATTGLLNSPNANAQIGQSAAGIAAGYGKQIAEAGTQGALAEEGLMTTGGPSAPLVGNALAQGQLAAQREQALGTAESAALQGTGQQLTAQQQAQSGLAAAGSLTQPSGNFPFVFNPATGQFTTGGTAGGTSGSIGLTLNPSTDIPAAVQAIQSNPSSYNSYTSAIASGYGANGGVIKGQLDAALLKAGLNPTNLAALSSGTASNVGTATTAQTNTYQGIYNTYSGLQADTNTALNQVTSLGNLALTTEQGGSINPFTVAAGNATLASLRQQLSSPAQGQFDQTMATFQGALSNLFSQSSTVTPTQISSWSTQISNGTMPLATLQAIYTQSIKEGNLKLNNITATKDYAKSQMNSGTSDSGSSSGSTTGTGGSSSTDPYASITYP